MVFKSGKWVGMYSYAESFDLFDENELTTFELEANASETVFTGTILEGPEEGKSNQLITVIGDITGEHIEFTKTYMENQYSVYYKGDWDQEMAAFKGFWEIEHYSFTNNEMLVHRSQGIWAMKIA